MTVYLEDTALSVAGLTSYIQDLLEGDRQLSQVWVTGEVSSVSNHLRGLFFTLSDPDGNAAIRCVVWQNLRLKLVTLPQKGDQAIVLGSIRVYPKRGDYQLTVFQVLAAGEGLQALRYQQLRSRLAAEGLFDPERKRPLPAYPQTIAVVTSPTAAAWGDIQRTLSQRYPGLHVLFSPAQVQGEKAPESIVTALERVNRDGRAEVVILARGGGAVEDLSCFNHERVVRAIAASSIPVVTGIGHQRDESLADLVADLCAHTPTAAAERTVPQYAQIVGEHQQRLDTLLERVKQQLERKSKHLEQLRSSLTRLPLTSRKLEQARSHCQLLRQKLAALDPHAVLQRGYAVVRLEDNTLIRSTATLVPGQELVIQLSQGSLKAKITEVGEADAKTEKDLEL